MSAAPCPFTMYEVHTSRSPERHSNRGAESEEEEEEEEEEAADAGGREARMMAADAGSNEIHAQDAREYVHFVVFRIWP